MEFELPESISICYGDRLGYPEIGKFRMNRHRFLINFLPHINHLTNNDWVVDIYFYEGIIENASFKITNKSQINTIYRVFLHEKTFEMISVQNLEFFTLNQKIIKVMVRLSSIISKFPMIIQNNIILYKGIVLSIYGLRSCSNIDIYLNRTKGMKDSDIKKLVKKLENFHFPINLTIKGIRGYWCTFSQNLEKNWCKKAKMRNFFDVFLPQNHFYFAGLKLINIELDMIYRGLFQTPLSYADILVYKKRLNPKIKIPVLISHLISITKDPRFDNEFGIAYFISDKMRCINYRSITLIELLEEIGNVLLEIYNIKISIQDLMINLKQEITINRK